MNERQHGTSIILYLIIFVLAVALTGVVAYDIGRGSVPQVNTAYVPGKVSDNNPNDDGTGIFFGVTPNNNRGEQPYLEPIVVPNREIPLSNSTYSYTTPDGKVHELDGEQTGSLTPDGRFIPLYPGTSTSLLEIPMEVTTTPARR